MGEILALATKLFPYLSCAFLAACSFGSERTNTTKEVLNNFNGKLKVASEEFTKLDRTGAPLMIVSVEERDGAIGTFVLQTKGASGIETWISADNISLAVDHGMVVGTRGFGGDLLSSDVSQSIEIVLNGQTGHTQRFHNFLDGNNQSKTRSFACTVSSRGPWELDLGKRTVPTRLMQEDCKSLDHSFRNYYWVDLTNQEILQSRQWIGDYSKTLAMRKVLR